MTAFLIFLAACLAAAPVRGKPTPYAAPSPEALAKELKRIHTKYPTVEERVTKASALFLGAPYKLGPLGEGEAGEFDRDPLWRLDIFDCMTYLETVMALAMDPDSARALDKTMQRIRYKEGMIGYKTRNHFPETDWIPQNSWAGFLKDVTAETAPDKVKQTSKLIAKKAWYVAKTTEDVQGFSSAVEQEKRLKELQRLGEDLLDQTAWVPYLPMKDLPGVLARIPSGTIGNLVREDRPDKIVVISHQILFVDKDGEKFVRTATYGKEVEDVPALLYFYRYFTHPWPLLGINLLRPLPQRDLERSAR